MSTVSMKNGNIPIAFIRSETELTAVIAELQKSKVIAFDTEFDRFRRGYGFKLYILQIFDGRTCYILDALSLKQLGKLWSIFEDEGILKVAYSCREDIEILKINGCNPRPVFDVQIAAALANSSAQSFSKLIEETFSITLDKEEQTSDWKKRPLSFSQLIYASNDVIHLLKLNAMYQEKLEQIGLMQALAEEVQEKVSATPVDFTPKLTPGQLAVYSEQHLEVLFRFFQLRDKYGKKLDMPPKNLVGDSILEDILKDKNKFVASPFQSGFSRRVLGDNGFLKEFMEIAESVPEAVNWKREKSYSNERSQDIKQKIERDKYLVKEFCEPIKKYVAAKYGEIAAEFILRGLRRKVDFIFSATPEMLPYQKSIILEAIDNLNLPKNALASYNVNQIDTQ